MAWNDDTKSWTIGGKTFKDKGGEGLFGAKDISTALAQGVKISDITAAIKASDLKGRPDDKQDTRINWEAAVEQAQSGTLGHGYGASGQWTGAADVSLFTQAQQGQGTGTGQIAQAISKQGVWNPDFVNTAGSGLSNMVGSIQGVALGQDALDVAQQSAADQAAHHRSEADKSKQYYQNMLDQQKESARLAAERARIEAMKVRSSSPSAVGQSAMGIRAARSPAYASGAASRGTGQFARSAKGTNVKTLNIA
mgnify:CR=1 FL=1